MVERPAMPARGAIVALRRATQVLLLSVFLLFFFLTTVRSNEVFAIPKISSCRSTYFSIPLKME